MMRRHGVCRPRRAGPVALLWRTVLWMCLVAAAAVPGGVGFAANNSDSAPIAMILRIGETKVINASGVKRIAVGNGKVLQATALDNRQILLIPEAAGQSYVHLWRKDGSELRYQVNVLSADHGRLADDLRAYLTDAQNITVRQVGDKVIVEGKQLTREQAQMLGELSRRFPQVINLSSKVELDRMIGMDVRMLEVKRAALKNIGIKWRNTGINGPSFGVVGDFHRSNALQPGGGAEGRAQPGDGNALALLPRVSPFASALSWVSAFTSALNLMVQSGEAIVLAEPRLSCRSGGSAKFLAGGELPIPYSSGLGVTSIIFKEFGVKFDVSPLADAAGNISAKVATEISSINNEIKVNEVPGFNKNRTETEVNLRENEIIVIAGLFSDDSSRTIDKLAGMGDLPVLGRLFRSRDFRERQTELLVLIQPYFASAEPAGENAAAVKDFNARAGPSRERLKMLD